MPRPTRSSTRNNRNGTNGTTTTTTTLQEVLARADADKRRHSAGQYNAVKANRARKRALQVLEGPNSFLEDIRYTVSPHLLNIWKLIVCDEERGLISVSRKYTKAMRRDEAKRQQLAEACFKAAINFQKRSREQTVPIIPTNLETEAAKKNVNARMLSLMEGLLPSDDIEDALIDMLKLHRSRKHLKERKDANGASKSKRIRQDIMAPMTSKRHREDDQKSDNSREILIYTTEAYKKAEIVRNEMMAEIILKWGLFDYKHMIAARRIEAKHMKRLLEPKLTFEKFCGGRFFTVLLERQFIPKLREQKKNDPDYKIMPIIARDLKHSKGHFAFSSIERNIRGKGPGDNWTIREYKPVSVQIKKGKKVDRRFVSNDIGSSSSHNNDELLYQNDSVRITGKRGFAESV